GSSQNNKQQINLEFIRFAELSFFLNLKKKFQIFLFNMDCWAAAKPGRSECGQNKAATLAAYRWPKIRTAKLAGQNIDGRPNVRPNLKRTATLAVRQNQRNEKFSNTTYKSLNSNREK
ncbi:hypothetical protein BpHYR1_003618, partial [Brachionus plicatilis]